MNEFKLENQITTVLKNNKNTPRIALSFNININEDEKIAGTYSLMARLLTQSTSSRNFEELANELDKNAIELSCDMKQDFLRFRLVCLNEDIELALELLSDIVKNADFAEFEQEKEKMAGELLAELDSARMKALDNFYKNIFENHLYGNTCSKVLETLKDISLDDVKNAYKNIMKTGVKIISLVGDIDNNRIKILLNEYLGQIENNSTEKRKIEIPVLKEQKTVEIIKSDVSQAQIIQGWIFPNFHNKDYFPLVVLNNILGSCGLSSRLFLELRDKKGLAYTVRSLFETYSTCGCFSIYIATEPSNIKISLDGFKEEIDKLKTDLITEKELKNAKNNIIGKQQFISETNAQQANLLAFYQTMDLGFDYQQKLIENIKKVTTEEVKNVANKYFDEKFVISILKP